MDAQLFKQRASSRSGMVVTSLALDRALHQRLAIAAIEDNAAFAVLVREAIVAYLDQREPRRKGKRGR
jgi:hypothetical protein